MVIDNVEIRSSMKVIEEKWSAYGQRFSCLNWNCVLNLCFRVLFIELFRLTNLAIRSIDPQFICLNKLIWIGFLVDRSIVPINQTSSTLTFCQIHLSTDLFWSPNYHPIAWSLPRQFCVIIPLPHQLAEAYLLPHQLPEIYLLTCQLVDPYPCHISILEVIQIMLLDIFVMSAFWAKLMPHQHRLPTQVF